MRHLCIVCLLTYYSLIVFAIDESYLDDLNSEYLVTSFSSSIFSKKNYFLGVGDKKINYYVFNAVNPKGVIIISPGKSEAALKYSELIFDIKNLGYTIYIIDHRGQGESDRLIDGPNDKTKSHIGKFSDYVDDFSQFVNSVVKPQNYKNSFIIAHSMGGAIASGFLVRYPKVVTGVVLSAPMFEIHTAVGAMGNLVAKALHNMQDPTSYAPFQKPYNANAEFKNNAVTSSLARFEMKRKLYNRFNQLQVGGTTVNWLKESIEFTEKLRKTENIYQVPTILLQAGKDKLVVADGQNQACQILSPKFCQIIKFEDSEHEIFMEKDSVRNKALAILKNFIKHYESKTAI